MSSENKLIVLVLESCGPIANNLKAIIERRFSNLEVRICENADEIVAQIGHSEIFLILAAIEEMGGMGENETGLLEAVKGESPQTKFIVMAGDSCDVTKVKKDGADDFLAKPFTLDSLRELINKAINA